MQRLERFGGWSSYVVELRMDCLGVVVREAETETCFIDFDTVSADLTAFDE